MMVRIVSCAYFLAVHVSGSKGEIEVFVNGERAILATLRESNESLVQGIHFQTFFGGKPQSLPPRSRPHARVSGHSPEWASPKTQRAWFSSISGAILANESHGSNMFSRHEDL